MSPGLIAGLGNPGIEYEKSRHNVGFMVIDAYAARYRAKWERSAKFNAMVCRIRHPSAGTIIGVKPMTFMNLSGEAVGRVSRYFGLSVERVSVVYDELNLDLGQTKISITGSAGGHNGVASLLQHLGDGFIRFRIGIGPKTPVEMDMKDFVLDRFTEEELQQVESNLPDYLNGLNLLIDRGVTVTMNQLNRRTQTDK
ncbi:MAG: aminoacyl-tRNA hydrolase [Verrucomicrobia bacterium]|nr:MAG: aminoacyl-tRNA hydrolase [Verrucomicrobiota bacterium]